ncbi:hypothetical protein [Bacillus sp. UNC41MFS5]|uniref:hypothetical protein n=1 Tax=Bacillus sp. UNC41MFS5 TaxID=1449046 RepID=UPI00047E4F59|nr:hypothetical protein [Bacillus sp. UNC41MFS5]
MDLDDIYKEFLYDLDIKNYSPRTIKGYKNNNKAFKTFSKSLGINLDSEIYFSVYFYYLGLNQGITTLIESGR